MADPQSTRDAAASRRMISDSERRILERLLQIPKLNNHEIAWVLDCGERTVQRRRKQFEAKGSTARNDTSKNAEKMKPHHIEILREWLAQNEETAMLDDMQAFLKRECGLVVSCATISRQLNRATGGHRKNGRAHRAKLRRLGQAEGQSQRPGAHGAGSGAPGADARLMGDRHCQKPIVIRSPGLYLVVKWASAAAHPAGH